MLLDGRDGLQEGPVPAVTADAAVANNPLAQRGPDRPRAARAGSRLPPTSWMSDAACGGVGAGEFFDSRPTGRRRCRRCPVAECCFWWAVVTEPAEAGMRFGIWGGATPAVRAKVAAVVGMTVARDRLAEALAQWAVRAGASGRERRAG